MVGIAGLLIVIIAATFAPLFTPYDPITIDAKNSIMSPNLSHWMGTDQFGRDVFSRVLYGARISLQLGFLSVLMGGTIGVILGLLATLYSKFLDETIMRSIDVLMAFPGILLALAVIVILGPGEYNVAIAVGISFIPIFVRVVRSIVLSINEEAYIEAARAIGCNTHRIAIYHIIPNLASSIIVLSTVALGWSIIIGASLSFLGLGPQPPTPEWGVDLSNGKNYLRAAWWVSTFPGLAIMLTVLSANLLGDGLREILDPKLRESELNKA